MKTEILNFLHEHWPSISLAIYELVARLVPTSKNLSLLDLLLKLTGKGLELTQKGVDKVVPNNQKNTLKSFLVFALLSLSIGANAQLNLNAKTLRLTDNVAAKDTLANAVDGQLYYNHNTQELRLRKSGTWISIGSAGGGLTGADNGLSISGTNAELGGTLNKNTSIAQNGFNTSFTGTGRVTFSPSATIGGINLGSVAVDPSAPNTGDFWYNSLSNNFKYRTSGFTSTNVGTITGLTLNRIPYVSTLNNQLVDDAGFTFNGTGDIVSAGRFVALTTSTLPGVNVGSFAGDPSTLVNGDLWYNSTSNNLRARINGVSYSWLQNSSGTNELPKSNASGNLTPTGIFSTSSGNLDLGNASTAGANRIITAVSSGASANIDFITQGSGSFTVNSNGVQLTSDNLELSDNGSTGNQINLQTTTGSITQSKSTSSGNGIPFIIQSASGFAGAGNDLDAENLRINGGDGDTNGDGGDIIIRPGLGNGTGINGNFGMLDGANKPMGSSTLVAGTVTVNNHLITANTRVFLTVQTPGGTQGFLSVSRVAGTSFTITSTSATETSSVAWLLVEPN